MGIVTKIRFEELGLYVIALPSSSSWTAVGVATKCVSHFTIRNSLWTEFWQRAAFFTVGIFLATILVFVEAMFYRTMVDKINDRVGRYYFFMMFSSADVEYFYMLVARCVHGRLKSDVH